MAREPPYEEGCATTSLTRRRARSGLTVSTPEITPIPEPEDTTELELLVFGNRHKIKRSKLIKKYDLAGLSDQHIINIAQKQMAADQRLAEAKAEADQRLAGTRAQPSAREVGDGSPTNQSDEPRPDDAD